MTHGMHSDEGVLFLLYLEPLLFNKYHVYIVKRTMIPL